jgi:hypothetical protein
VTPSSSSIPKGRTLLTCLHCGRQFSRINYYVYRRRGRVFCSADCRSACQTQESKKRHVCRECGRDMSKINGTAGWVCSPECARKGWRKRSKVCATCGNQFETLYEKTKYCSRTCYLIGRPIAPLRHCPQCGKAFRPKNAKSALPHSCCSSQCASLYNRGERHPRYRGNRNADRGPTWKESQEATRKRDGDICVCLIHDTKAKLWRKEKCSVDHIVPYRVVIALREKGADVDANHLDNLVSFCRRCHQVKTSGIEPILLQGNIEDFRVKLARLLPLTKVDTALSLYGLK